VRDGGIFGDVITGAIEDEGGVAARKDIASVLAVGTTRAAVAPRCGQTAPKM
jgi:hypothetical protein